MKILSLILPILSYVNSAKILAVIPTPSISHQLPFIPLWRELSLRGHQVTLLTTDPLKDSSLTNLTEIDMSYGYEIVERHDSFSILSDETKSLSEIRRLLQNALHDLIEAQMTSIEVQNLIHDKNVHFDVAIIEAQLPFHSAFAWRFGCPMIGVTSMEAPVWIQYAIGNEIHPILNPDSNLHVVDQMKLNFRERIFSFLLTIFLKYKVYGDILQTENARFKKYFGEDAPDLLEVQNNISLLLSYANPVFQNTRPMNPNSILIGHGMHINKPKKLPKDLQEYLDSSKNGVIYFSLGSNVKGHLLNDTIKRNILQAFSELPYNVLMKMDTDLKDVPKNVKIQKWLPQQDVLRHPNIKLFISQGGLQSLQESITNGIPLVGIPFFGDQISNVYRMVKKGYGVRVDKNEITKENFKQAILEVLNNPRYREKAKEMGELLHDEPMTSLEKAVWWIEYVIRHKGAKHLRSPAVDMPAWKYYMLDVIGSVLGALFIVLFLSYKILKCVISKLLFGKPKAKKD
ncbi:unnamed protein product [Brassicogethes aeneus]|uniref:UDP-glucuronosyltransferase n=1 Tax=Brassicogethes aeneus TaxID=1431903 RepID=A0A9P0AQE8_BRAAE|nr:unnamed protein product [Brassicogethes aeneus]